MMGAWTVLCAVGSDAMCICHVRCNLRSAEFGFKSKSVENMDIKIGGLVSRQWVVADWCKIVDT